METLPQKMAAAIQKYHMLPPGGRVLCGVSGGADSVCLLLALKELGYRVHALHVEHGIRGEESLKDCRFVEALCRDQGILLQVISIDAPALAAKYGRTLEEAARDARYEALVQTAGAQHVGVIATAHHLGDQAETVLWNLIRGSGLAGLGGMAPVREIADAQVMAPVREIADAQVMAPVQEDPGSDDRAPGVGVRLVRPLLGVRRSEIEAWLRARGQDWCLDATNEEETITRNAIRRHVIPQLEAQNPRAMEHIAQAAEDLRQAEAFLGREAEKAAKGIYQRNALPGRQSWALPGRQLWQLQELREAQGAVLLTEPLLELDPVLRRRVLHRILSDQLGGARDITRAHIRALEQLAGMDNGHAITLPGGKQAIREADPAGAKVIRFYPSKAGKERSLQSSGEQAAGLIEDTPCEIPLTGPGTYRFLGVQFTCRYGVGSTLPIPEKQYTKWLAYDTIGPNICLRTRQAGDYLIVNAQGGRKKLKDYLIDRKIPRAQRDRLILAAQGNHVLWVVGERISEGARVKEGMPYLELRVELLQ